MQTRYVNTASSAGGDGTTNATSGSTRAFATLREALDSLPSTLSDAYTIYCTGTAADTSDCNQTPFDFTTSATNYLLITTTGADRPGTTYSTSKYRLESTNRNALYNNSSCHVRIDGLQVKVTVNNAGSYIGIKTTNANQSASDIDMRVTNCMVVGVQTSGTVTGYESRPTGGTISKNIFANCVAIDCNYGFGGDEASGSRYNCGAYDCTYGFVADAAWTAKNCIAHGATIGYVGSFSGSSADNAEDDGNGAPGTGSSSAVTFSFTNAGSDDFSLAVGDTGAKDQGTDLSGDAYYAFSTDLLGNTRTGTWDRGPFEYGAGGDTTPPTLSAPVGSATSSTAATVGATTDEGNGTLYAVVTGSATQPSVAQIKAGNDHTGSAAVWSGNVAVSSTGAKTLNATGLTGGSSYYVHLVHTDAAANDSNRVTSSQWTQLVKKVKLKLDLAAAGETVDGIVWANQSGAIAGAEIGEFTGQTIATGAGADAGFAVLKVPVTAFGGGALNVGDTVQVYVRKPDLSKDSDVFPATVIEE